LGIPPSKKSTHAKKLTLPKLPLQPWRLMISWRTKPTWKMKPDPGSIVGLGGRVGIRSESILIKMTLVTIFFFFWMATKGVMSLPHLLVGCTKACVSLSTRELLPSGCAE
jgi:hypothetical protein